jgi:hypothetical protein
MNTTSGLRPVTKGVLRESHASVRRPLGKSSLSQKGLTSKRSVWPLIS